MGRRTTSTKGGRYMNPADQARKIARRRELKKNKKQRLMVRQAVLRNKDPEELLRNIALLDEMEFSYEKAPVLNSKVICDKRIKMRETFFRIMSMYKRENDTANVNKMRRLLEEYEIKRAEMEKSYLTAKFAAETDPSEIPLPSSLPPPECDYRSANFNCVVPPSQIEYSASPQIHSSASAAGILKKRTHVLVPGIPAGPLPTLSDIDSEGDDEFNGSEAEDGEEVLCEPGEITDSVANRQQKETKVQKKVTFAEADKPETQGERAEKWPPFYQQFQPPVTNLGPFSMPPNVAPPEGFVNPPPFPGAPVDPSNMPVRMPFIGPLNPAVDPSHAAYVALQANGPVIEAQPQLHNVQQEVTRLVPTAVRIRKALKPNRVWSGSSGLVPAEASGKVQYKKEMPQKTEAVSREEVYQQFMAELGDLL
uniref:WW domain-binding protein 11 n=1 Tax=Trichuris muris TaxID=70415 RepID=A0A5S6Q9C7_TRIMR